MVCSFGDASANHSTSVGALNSASWCAHQGVPLPVLFVCEDNGVGISTRSPSGWTARSMSSLPAIEYAYADGSEPESALATDESWPRWCAASAVLRCCTCERCGSWATPAPTRSWPTARRTEILADYDRDPILATVRALVSRGAITAGALERYETVRRGVAAWPNDAGHQATGLCGRRWLRSSIHASRRSFRFRGATPPAGSPA